jgi:hypothetical protein
MKRRYSEKEEAFWRKMVLSGEDRMYLKGATWNGGYRWFRSENVVCLEHYRPAEINSAPQLKAS